MRYILSVLMLLVAVPTFAAPLPEYNISIIEHKFKPTTLEVPVNTKFKLIVKNMDKTPEEFESHDLHLEKIIMGKSKAIFIVKPLKEGTYKFFGEFNPKTAQGKVIAK